jgi:hypothetical protein
MELGMKRVRWTAALALLTIVALATLAPAAAAAGVTVKLQAVLHSGSALFPQASGQVLYEGRTATDKRLQVTVLHADLSPQVEPHPALEVFIDGKLVGQITVFRKGQGQLRIQGADIPTSSAGTLVEVRTATAAGGVAAGTSVLSGSLQ